MGFVSPVTLTSRRNVSTPHRCMHRPHFWRRARPPRACAEPAALSAETIAPEDEASLRVPDAIAETAHAAADEAGAVVRRYFRTGLASSAKKDDSPVTKADKEAEAAIRAVITTAFPSHTILGEESGGVAADELAAADWAWVIDPIDGTKAFMTGKPTFGILIAVLRRGIPVFGLIDQPVARERWDGGFGRPATFNGEPARSVERGGLGDCVLHATTPDMFVGLDGAAFRAVSARAKHTVYGADCYAYALLASGHVDVVVEADLKPWDFLALAPVVEASGGVMVDWYGQRIMPDCDGRVVAGAGHEVVAEALEALEKGLDPPSGFEDPGPGHVQAVTGFGAAEERDDSHSVKVRIRAERCDVCQVVVRAPKAIAEYEAEIMSIVEQQMVRGRIDVSISVFNMKSAGGEGVAASEGKIARQAAEVLKTVAPNAQPTVSDVLHMMDRLSARHAADATESSPPSLELVRKAVLSACTALISTRRKAGAALERNALERIAKINDIVEQLGLRLKDATKAAEGEVPAWGDGVEQVRAHAHMLAVGFMGIDGGVGVKLSLLSREIARSGRAISEGATDAIIVHHGILVEEEALALKEIGERIR